MTTTAADLTKMGDLDLLVAHEQAVTDTFGYGSYRHEHKAQQERNRAYMETLRAEALRRELITKHGTYTPKGKQTGVETDRRVLAKQADNQAYFNARFGGRGHHVSPYGERY